MLKIEDILREDFDWENVEIDEDEFDELENQLIINYLKKNSPKERQLLAIDWNFDNSKEESKRYLFTPTIVCSPLSIRACVRAAASSIRSFGKPDSIAQ